jgi:gliding motility-associated-like protein
LAVGTVAVTVTDANQCVTADSIMLIQPSELLLSLAIDSNASCHGGADGKMTATISGGTPWYTYSWSNGAQLPNTQQLSHIISGLTVGNYIVTVTDSNGCTKQADSTIVERAGPQETASPVLQQPTCKKSNGKITVNYSTSDPPLTFSWSHNTSLNSAIADSLPQGSYTVSITDKATCDTSFVVPLSEIPGPTVNLNKIKDSYCDDNDGQATAIVTGGTPAYTFTWINEDNDTISRDSLITGLSEGLYSLIVSDFYGCDTLIPFPITNIAKPKAQIYPESPLTIAKGTAVQLVGTSDIPTSVFAWEPDLGLSCSSCDTLTAQPPRSLTYTLRVIDSITSCKDSAFMTIIVKDDKNIFIPNVITPNGDGVNDVWVIKDLLEVFPDNEVVIVNRWGDEMFRTKSYGINSNMWDGLYKGEKVPDGTYYYIIKLNNIEKTVTGPITVISE